LPAFRKAPEEETEQRKLFLGHTAEEDIFCKFQRAGRDFFVNGAFHPAGGRFICCDAFLGPECSLCRVCREDFNRNLVRINALVYAAVKAAGASVIDIYDILRTG
jgi:hypothetical protein